MNVVFTLTNITDIWKDWQNNKFDGIVAITGKRGNGKSTLAIKGCQRNKQFKMHKHIAFKREDVMKLLAKGRSEVILADEMINVTYNRDFFSQQQKDLIKMLNMYRDRFNILVACVPNFYDLDKQFRNLVKMRLDVVKRGLAIVHTPNQTTYSGDIWDMVVNEKVERKWLEKQTFRPRYSKLSTYRGILRFGKLLETTEKKYVKLKEHKRNEVYEDDMESKDKKDNPFLIVLKKIKKGLITPEMLPQMAGVMGYQTDSFMNRLRKELKQTDNIKLSQLLLGSKNSINRSPHPNLQIPHKIPVI